MRYQITDGTVTAGGNLILSHIDFEIRGTEKIAVIGKNGAGKTTLLRLIAGELELDRDDKRRGPGIVTSRKLTAELLHQQAFAEESHTVEEELFASCPCDGDYTRERDTLFTGFGFRREDKQRQLSSFSGGEKTKLALIRLLLAKPDILLLDEPTNHLDIQTVRWLERYLKSYGKAVVMVSHDRFFLDRTADAVYELEGGRLTRYPGNYTAYREQRQKNLRLRQKAYDRQQEEIGRLEQLVERFKHKPNKAAFARAKKKTIERMERLPKPEGDGSQLVTRVIEPLIPGGKWVFEAEHLKIGYDKPVLELSLRIRKGQKIGLLGDNGVGKTTFLKTVAGLLPPMEGVCSLGKNITVGYFDQLSAEISSEKTVADHFHDLFPVLTEKEVRTILGAYLFGGRAAGKRVSDLSGGEKARLVLAELLESRPNFLILDEPTNHMDIQARETLEAAFAAYKGTILFVSHDRYFIRQVAESVLIFENQAAMYYPFGYEHYLERCERAGDGESPAARVSAEEQALIEGLRTVPKAERHRLREISTDEARADWVLSPLWEKIGEWSLCVEELGERLDHMRSRRNGGEDFWLGRPWELEAEYGRLKAEYETAWENWHAACLEWYDAALEEDVL